MRGDQPKEVRQAALASAALCLTRTPWDFGADQLALLHEAGLGAPAIVQVLGIASFFNYVTRVADALGIEFDYQSPLKRLQVDRRFESAGRAPRLAPPPTGPPLGLQPVFAKALQAWKAYVLETDAPLSQTERAAVALRIAEILGDARGAARFSTSLASTARLKTILSFAEALTLRQWTVSKSDIASLREDGFMDEAVLAIVALIASCNTFSRIGMALGEV